MNLLHLEQMNSLLIVSMNFLQLERVIYIISYSCRLYEPHTPRTDEYITHSLYEPTTLKHVKCIILSHVLFYNWFYCMQLLNCLKARNKCIHFKINACRRF